MDMLSLKYATLNLRVIVHLKAQTIKDLMLHMCSSKFEIEQRESDFAKEYVSAGEAAAIQQERDRPITC